MSDEIQKYLFDIQQAINHIDLHLNHERDFNFFLNNLTTRRAVERELEIIGEACNRILKAEPDILISHARQIVDLRNRVIHSYDAVDEMVLWQVINHYLPILKNEVDQLIS